MNRLLIALLGAALFVGAIGLATLQPASAQPSGPLVCLSLAPGEHTFTAPSQDREGEVSFTVTVGEGGLVTAFTEPGGQAIPPAALLEIFAGEDAYPLPDGVTFIECEVGGDSMMEEGPAAGLCLNLGPGSYDENVQAAGQTYSITINVGEQGQLISVDVLGETYDPQQALDLLASFGASIPPHIEIVPCAAPTDDAAAYPTTGTGGIADSSGLTGLWAGLGSLAVLAIAIAALAQRRRVAVRNRD